MNKSEVISSIYHRSQKPYVYLLPNNGVGVVLKVAKSQVASVKLYYGDPMDGYDGDKWAHSLAIMKHKGSSQYHDFYEATMRNIGKRYRYAFVLELKNGDSFYYGESGELENENLVKIWGHGFTYSYWHENNMDFVPGWYPKTSWYQIFPDRFAKSQDIYDVEKEKTFDANGHHLYGGNLKGIIEKLSYIKKLGFSGIYLTPIFEAKTSHRYDTKDYYKIDPILGTEEDFQELINKAHKLNIKIMIDAVFNHIGYHSKEFQDVIKNKKNSKYADWFWINDFDNLKQPSDYDRKWFSEKYPYETFAMVPEMPRINWDNKEAREHLIRAAEKWTKMGIDGWRLDVSFEPHQDFWRAFNRRVRKINPQIAIIGEMWWDAIEFLGKDLWSGTMNYNFPEVVIDYVKSNQELEDKQEFIAKFNYLSYIYTPKQQWGMFNLFSSHDVERLITKLKNDDKRFKKAVEILFLQPGAPSTYYGEEIGLEGGQDPDNRRLYPWNENKDKFFDFYISINKKRTEFWKDNNLFNRFYAYLDYDKSIVITNEIKKIIISDNEVQLEKFNNKR